MTAEDENPFYEVPTPKDDDPEAITACISMNTIDYPDYIVKMDLETLKKLQKVNNNKLMTYHNNVYYVSKQVIAENQKSGVVLTFIKPYLHFIVEYEKLQDSLI